MAGLTRITSRRSNSISLSLAVFVFGITLPLFFQKQFNLISSKPLLFMGIGLLLSTLLVARFIRDKKVVAWVLLWISCLLLGAGRSTAVLQAYIHAPDHVSSSWMGTITNTRVRLNQFYETKTASVRIASLGHHVTIPLPPNSTLKNGDGISFQCALFKSDIRNAARNIWYECKKPDHLTSAPEYNSWLHRLARIPVQTLEQTITKTLPGATAPFTAGILLGIDDRIPKNIKDDFRAIGTAHIFALSGFNIALIATLIASVFAWLAIGSRNRFIMTASALGFFVFATGLASSSLRALIMGLTILIGRYSGRIARTRILIPLAASLMLAISPLVLRYDIGFQLSFLATIGIITLGSPLRERLRRVPNTFALRETMAATFAASLATAPILVTLGNAVGPKTIIANMLIGPLVPAAMLFGFSGAIASTALPPLAPLISALASLPAQTIIDTAHVLARW